jgi:hypothetical protein
MKKVIIASGMAALAVFVSLCAFGESALASQHRAFFDPTTYEISESNAEVTITVKRDGNSSTQTDLGSIEWETVPGSANTADFVSATGTVTFPPGNGLQTFTVRIRDDGAHEGNEAFQIQFKENSNTGSIDIHDGPATVTIVDNDAAPPPPVAPASPTPRASPTAAAPSPSPSPVPSPSPSPTESPTPSPTPTARAAAASDGGPPWGLIIGLLALFIASGAGVALWYLRRAEQSAEQSTEQPAE